MANAADAEDRWALRDEHGEIVYKTIPIMECGVHPQNRSNFYTQGTTVVGLGNAVLNQGFSCDVANENGVAVQEVPWNMREAGYQSILDYNLSESKKDPKLNGLYGEEDDIRYGMVGHNHLLQVSRGFLKGMMWPMEFKQGSGIRVHDSKGRLTISALEAHANTRQLGQFLKTGFVRVKILKWQISVVEPEAVTIISQSRNQHHKTALEEHEWSAISTLNNIWTKESTVEMLKKTALGIVGDLADDVDFGHVIEFVHRLNGAGSKYLEELLTFANIFVDSKKQRMAYKGFKPLNSISSQFPLASQAILMKTYMAESNTAKTKYVIDPSTQWGGVAPSWMQQLEAVLNYTRTGQFGTALAACRMKGEDDINAEQATVVKYAFLGKKTIEAFEGLAFKNKKACSVHKVRIEILKAVRNCLERWGLVEKAEKPANPELEWIDFNDPRTQKEEKRKPGRPKQNKDSCDNLDVPGDAEDCDNVFLKAEKPNTTEDITVPWLQWRATPLFNDHGRQSSAEAHINSVLRTLALGVDARQWPIDILYLGPNKVKVVATRDLEPLEVYIPAHATKNWRLVADSVHPLREKIYVSMNESSESLAESILQTQVKSVKKSDDVQVEAPHATVGATLAAAKSDDTTHAAKADDTAPAANADGTALAANADGTALAADSNEDAVGKENKENAEEDPLPESGSTKPPDNPQAVPTPQPVVTKSKKERFAKGTQLIERATKRKWTVDAHKGCGTGAWVKAPKILKDGNLGYHRETVSLDFKTADEVYKIVGEEDGAVPAATETSVGTEPPPAETKDDVADSSEPSLKKQRTSEDTNTENASATTKADQPAATVPPLKKQRTNDALNDGGTGGTKKGDANEYIDTRKEQVYETFYITPDFTTPKLVDVNGDEVKEKKAKKEDGSIALAVQ